MPLNNDKIKPVNSSTIQSYEYDADDRVLKVNFATGTTYTYKNIKPETVSQVFDSPGSVGAKFYKLINKRSKGEKE